MAAGAARPTPIIDSAKAGSICAKELLAAQLKPPFCSRAPTKWPSSRKAM